MPEISLPVSKLVDKHLSEVAVSARAQQIVGAHETVFFPSQKIASPHPQLSEFFKGHPVHALDHSAPAPPPGATAKPPSPPPQLPKLDLDTGPISFNNGVAVGGFSHLSLFPNGAFSFTGHFHDSGAASYDGNLVWALRSGPTVFTFVKSGRMHGTFEAGSRDLDWGDSGTNAAIGDCWAAISLEGYAWYWNSAVDIDLGQLYDTVVKAASAVGTVANVVKVVGSLL